MATNTPVRAIDQTSDYRDKLIKLIPSEIIGAFITIQGLCAAANTSEVPLQISASILFLILPLYLWFVFGVRSKLHLFFTEISFCVWIYNVAGQWVVPQVYHPVAGPIVLIFWTLLIPLIPSQKLGAA